MITIEMSTPEAYVALAALREAAADLHASGARFPQLDAVIDTLHAQLVEIEADERAANAHEPYESNDLSDDAEALASAGHGMDEDYSFDSYQEDY